MRIGTIGTRSSGTHSVEGGVGEEEEEQASVVLTAELLEDPYGDAIVVTLPPQLWPRSPAEKDHGDKEQDEASGGAGVGAGVGVVVGLQAWLFQGRTEEPEEASSEPPSSPSSFYASSLATTPVLLTAVQYQSSSSSSSSSSTTPGEASSSGGGYGGRGTTPRGKGGRSGR